MCANMAEDQLIARRAQMKAALKAEFVRQQYNPYRFINGNEPVFDPAVQRWMAMRACQYDYFKATPKTSFYGLLTLMPVVVLTYFVHKDRSSREQSYSTGQVSYRDRKNKFY